MTQRIVTVTECPYCNAGVYLKAQAIIDTKGLDVEKFICLDEQPDQQVAIYDRCRPDSPPCPHLYLLQGSGEQLEEYPTRDICLDFSFGHPDIPKFEEETGVHFGLRTDFHPEPDDVVKLEAHFIHRDFDEYWFDRIDVGELRVFRVQGEVMFVEDIVAFHAEFPDYHAKLDEWIAAGRPQPKHIYPDDEGEYEYEEEIPVGEAEG